MPSPLATQRFEQGRLRVAVTRHGAEDSSDYSATIHVASLCFTHAPSKAEMLRKVRASLAQLISDISDTALSIEIAEAEEATHE